jgi:hypothetical protein
MRKPIDALELKLPTLIESHFGVVVTCSHARFEESGWTFQGTSDINCGDCRSEVRFIIYRKQYTTTQGSYRYWAIVCLSCRTVNALVDFHPDDQKVFRMWDMQALL